MLLHWGEGEFNQAITAQKSDTDSHSPVMDSCTWTRVLWDSHAWKLLAPREIVVTSWRIHSAVLLTSTCRIFNVSREPHHSFVCRVLCRELPESVSDLSTVQLYRRGWGGGRGKAGRERGDKESGRKKKRGRERNGQGKREREKERRETGSEKLRQRYLATPGQPRLS